jgi:hypothetical protein
MKRTRRRTNNKSYRVPYKIHKHKNSSLISVHTKKHGQYKTVLQTTSEDDALDIIIALYGYSDFL